MIKKIWGQSNVLSLYANRPSLKKAVGMTYVLLTIVIKKLRYYKLTESKSKYSGNIILASRLFRLKNVGEICLCQPEGSLNRLEFT